MIVEVIEHDPLPCPEGCWPGHPQAGRVLVGKGDFYPAECGSWLPGRESMTSIWVVFPDGPDRPAHTVGMNGWMTAQETAEAISLAREVLR